MLLTVVVALIWLLLYVKFLYIHYTGPPSIIWQGLSRKKMQYKPSSSIQANGFLSVLYLTKVYIGQRHGIN